MAKNKFLLIDLNESKTKKVAETISSSTSRKILNYLADKDKGETETKIAKELGLALSTVHYHLHNLTEAGLVVSDEFHYSKKGREVSHYKLANKYIIIAPKKVSGLKQKLKSVLPVLGITAGVSVIMKMVQSRTPGIAPIAEYTESAVLEAQALAQQQAAQQPDVALWFMAGSIVALFLYVVFSWLWERFS
jgi:predicted ArsR family transcriptional regulator